MRLITGRILQPRLLLTTHRKQAMTSTSTVKFLTTAVQTEATPHTPSISMLPTTERATQCFTMSQRVRQAQLPMRNTNQVLQRQMQFFGQKATIHTRATQVHQATQTHQVFLMKMLLRHGQSLHQERIQQLSSLLVRAQLSWAVFQQIQLTRAQLFPKLTSSTTSL